MRSAADRRRDSLVTAMMRRQAATPRRRLVVLAVSVLGIAAIGLIDSLTGDDLSFAIFYLLPVSGAALVVPRTDGYGLAALAAVTWAIAERKVFGAGHPVASSWNFVGRFITMCVVVYLLGALRATVVRLWQSEQASREFLATAAHQLRTPLAGLVASAEALAYEDDPARRSGLVDNLVAGTNRSRRLLSSLLEMSRLDQAIPSERRPVELVAIVHRELENVRIANPDVAVDYDGPPEVDVVASGDSVREALANLIDNAVRHADAHVVVRLRAVGGGAVLEVVDDGPGLPAGAEDRAFERFVSLDGAGGSGLGLAIARASLRASGGDLTYEAHCFRMTLP